MLGEYCGISTVKIRILPSSNVTMLLFYLSRLPQFRFFLFKPRNLRYIAYIAATSPSSAIHHISRESIKIFTNSFWKVFVVFIFPLIIYPLLFLVYTSNSPWIESKKIKFFLRGISWILDIGVPRDRKNLSEYKEKNPIYSCYFVVIRIHHPM